MKTEELRDEFLDHVAHLVGYWDNVKDQTTFEKLQGLAFSMLVALDGESANFAGFSVVSVDQEDEHGDIAGSLHELFFQHFE